MYAQLFGACMWQLPKFSSCFLTYLSSNFRHAAFQSEGSWRCHSIMSDIILRMRLPAGSALSASDATNFMSSDSNASEYIAATYAPQYRPSLEFIALPAASANFTATFGIAGAMSPA